MKQRQTSQSGIALITTIILTSIMLSSIVLITKEMADEVVNSTRLDNSMIAYYAAEAGIEDALLEFRYDHSAEISKENDGPPPDPNTVNVLCVPPTNDCTYRTVNLSTGSTDYGARAYNTSYYDLVMWNKVKSILDQKILKDNVAEFVVPNMTKNVILSWTPEPEAELISLNSGFRVEITVYDENGSIIPPTGITDSLGRTGGKYFSDPNTTTYIVRTTVGLNKKIIIRIKPSYVDKGSYNPVTGSYSEGEPLPGGITPSINLNINKPPTVDFIASTTTKIESIGYYGGVARKISATVDRPSGNILNIFDYAIYSGSDLIK